MPGRSRDVQDTGSAEPFTVPEIPAADRRGLWGEFSKLLLANVIGIVVVAILAAFFIQM